MDFCSFYICNTWLTMYFIDKQASRVSQGDCNQFDLFDQGIQPV